MGEERSISETITDPGPPLGCSEGVGGGIMAEAGEEGRGAASSELVSIMSSCLEDWVELREVLPDRLRPGLDITIASRSETQTSSLYLYTRLRPKLCFINFTT